MENKIFILKTTANREDQVIDFVTDNIMKKNLGVYSAIRPHGLRGYIILEARSKEDADESHRGVPYAKNILKDPVEYDKISHMLQQVKIEVKIQKGDIVEIIAGPFKREKAKITRIDNQKDEVIVELLEAAVPIPITVKFDAVKVIRRDTEEETESEEENGKKTNR